MDRRNFLKWVGGATAVGTAGVLVPEAIGAGVWQRVKSYFFLGNGGGVSWQPVTTTERLALSLEKMADKIPLLFERDDVFYFAMSRKPGPLLISPRDMRLPLTFNPKFHRSVDRAIQLNESLEEG